MIFDPSLTPAERALYERLTDVFFAPFTVGNKTGFKVKTYQLGEHYPLAAFQDAYPRQGALAREAVKLNRAGAFDKLLIGSGDVKTGLPPIGIVNLLRITSPQKLGMDALSRMIIDPSSIHTGTDIDIALNYARKLGLPTADGKHEILIIARPWHALRGALTAMKKQQLGAADLAPAFHLATYAGVSSGYFARSPETLSWMWSELSGRINAGLPQDDSAAAVAQAAAAPVAALPGYSHVKLARLRNDLATYLASQGIDPQTYARATPLPGVIGKDPGTDYVRRAQRSGLLRKFASSLTAAVPSVTPLSVSTFSFNPTDADLWEKQIPMLKATGVAAIVAVPSALGLKSWADPAATPDYLAAVKKRYADAGITINSMQSIGLPNYTLFSDKLDDHARFTAHIESLCKIATTLGVQTLNFGAANNRSFMGDTTAVTPLRRDAVTEHLTAVAAIAERHGVTFALEPIAPIYGGNYGSSMQECLAIAQQIDSPNFKVLLDTYAAHANGDKIADIEPAIRYISQIELSAPLLGTLYGDGPDSVDNTAYIELAVRHRLPINIEVKAALASGASGKPAMAPVASMSDLVNSAIITRAAITAASLRQMPPRPAPMSTPVRSVPKI